MLLQRMVADNVRFSPQAVARLANYGFTRGEPAAAYTLFKVRSAGLLDGAVTLVCGHLGGAPAPCLAARCSLVLASVQPALQCVRLHHCKAPHCPLACPTTATLYRKCGAWAC